jgi:hypothetical protein
MYTVGENNTNEKNRYILVDFGSSFCLNDQISARPNTSSPGYSPKEQNTDKECYLTDIYPLGVCFSKTASFIFLSDTKTKIINILPQKIQNMFDQMKEDSLEKRISLEECIQIVSQCYNEKFGSNSIDENFYYQPFLSDIVSLRFLIFYLDYFYFYF